MSRRTPKRAVNSPVFAMLGRQSCQSGCDARPHWKEVTRVTRHPMQTGARCRPGVLPCMIRYGLAQWNHSQAFARMPPFPYNRFQNCLHHFSFSKFSPRDTVPRSVSPNLNYSIPGCVMAGECRAVSHSRIHPQSQSTHVTPRAVQTIMILRSRRVGPSTPSPFTSPRPLLLLLAIERTTSRLEERRPCVIVTSNLNDVPYTIFCGARENASRPCYCCDAFFFLWNVGGSLAGRVSTGSGMMACASSKRTPKSSILPYRLLVLFRVVTPLGHHYANYANKGTKPEELSVDPPHRAVEYRLVRLRLFSRTAALRSPNTYSQILGKNCPLPRMFSSLSPH